MEVLDPADKKQRVSIQLEVFLDVDADILCVSERKKHILLNCSYQSVPLKRVKILEFTCLVSSHGNTVLFFRWIARYLCNFTLTLYSILTNDSVDNKDREQQQQKS